MALHKKTYDLCSKYLQPNYKIAELGAQYLMGEEWGEYGPPYFKNVFNNLDITSFDITGENDSIIMNLSKDIPDDFKNKFDIITNFGTTEHVQNQYICWKNIFDMVKLNGIVISEIPKKDNWHNHCKYYFDEDTFKSMHLDFKIIDIQDRWWEGNGNNIYCVMEKTHQNKFKTQEKILLDSITIIEGYNDGQGI
jgi:hypothetical protein